jgi:hypothetical protein
MKVFAAACQVMRRWLNIPDNEHWEGPSNSELAEFLHSLDRRQLQLFKEFTEGMIEETNVVVGASTTTLQ